MIKSNKQTAQVHVDPLSINAEIIVLSGNETQVYDKESKEYSPDRALVPLIMLPKVAAIDPHNVQNGEQVLTNVEWFEGTPKQDSSNKITSVTTGYEIGDGTVVGFPKFALKCKKNINPDNPIEIFGIAVFTDKRTNTEVKVTRSKNVHTAYYDAQSYSVSIDQPEAWTIDPLKEVEDAQGQWKHTITAQLYSGEKKVADANAAYFWQVFELINNVWVEAAYEDYSMWIDCKDSSGNFTKTLSFDARLVGTTLFKCRAAFYNSERPTSPTTDEIQASTTVKMEMPHSIDVLTRQTKGVRMKPDMSTPVGFHADIIYNKGIIEGKDNFFQIEWIGKSVKPGSREIKLGVGRDVEFVPAAKGFDKNYAINVYAQVKLYDGHKVAVITDPTAGNTIVTVGGTPVIVPTYN